MNDRRTRGISGASVLIFILFLFGALWFTNQMDQRDNELNWKQFEKVIRGDNVKSINITQNKNVPTGRVEIELRSGKNGTDTEVKYLYTSDVNEVQKYLKNENIENYTITNVPQESWFANTIVPMLLMIGGIALIFTLMNRREATRIRKP